MFEGVCFERVTVKIEYVVVVMDDNDCGWVIGSFACWKMMHVDCPVVSKVCSSRQEADATDDQEVVVAPVGAYAQAHMCGRI